ncbi:MAG: AraC family transcriptional regulator [Lachnospiraceae bacterium]|jgi:AraC-like DNA-binding protein|nr:AraC family transcriptional regulator [Lachnospiraceae bacterium]
MATLTEKQLKYMEYIHRENDDRHHTVTEDMYQYDLLRIGDPRAIEEGVRMFSSDLPGHVSDDPVRNYKYLFVASITLASRSAIAGGMAAERAYNISDLYILKMDTLRTIDEIKALHADMFAFYTKEMAALDKIKVYSKPITLCLDYIYHHLHESISVRDLAEQVHLNESYLSTLFKKETGCSISSYILSKRMEAAQNMLKFSDYTYAEISAILAFSSQSHFIRAFKKHTGYTPKRYRDAFFQLPVSTEHVQK